MKHVPYRYGHLPIPGGGYVTGFLFHPAEEGLLYIRTDVGGTYRFDRAAQRWVCLIPHVTMENPAQANPISIAVDEKHPARLYVACGLRNAPTGELAVSEDYGETFAVHPMPMFVHETVAACDRAAAQTIATAIIIFFIFRSLLILTVKFSFEYYYTLFLSFTQLYPVTKKTKKQGSVIPQTPAFSIFFFVTNIL